MLYPGENDIARGVSPETVATGFEKLVTTVHTALRRPDPRDRPEADTTRWRFNDQMLETNRLLRGIAARHENIIYISVEKAMLDPTRCRARTCSSRTGST